jgi:hypothetical protein
MNVIYTDPEFVYFSDNTHMTHLDYGLYQIKSAGMSLLQYSNIQEASQLITLDERTALENASPTGMERRYMERVSTYPCIALKYVVLRGPGNRYSWQFANRRMPHKAIVDEYSVLFPEAEGWAVLGGGFYSYQCENAMKNTPRDVHQSFDLEAYLWKEPVLWLFGQSDSYPLKASDLIVALDHLPNAEHLRVMVMFEHNEFTHFKTD